MATDFSILLGTRATPRTCCFFPTSSRAVKSVSCLEFSSLSCWKSFGCFGCQSWSRCPECLQISACVPLLCVFAVVGVFSLLSPHHSKRLLVKCFHLGSKLTLGEGVPPHRLSLQWKKWGLFHLIKWRFCVFTFWFLSYFHLDTSLKCAEAFCQIKISLKVLKWLDVFKVPACASSPVFKNLLGFTILMNNLESATNYRKRVSGPRCRSRPPELNYPLNELLFAGRGGKNPVSHHTDPAGRPGQFQG